MKALVSTIALNGYPVGNDGTGNVISERLPHTDMQPYLTYAAALAATTQDDVIYFNGNSAGITGAWDDVRTVIDMVAAADLNAAESRRHEALFDYSVELISSVGLGVFYLRGDKNAFGKLWINRAGGSNLIRGSTGADPGTDLLINGTRFLVDGAREAIEWNGSITMLGDWLVHIINGAENQGAINCVPSEAGSIIAIAGRGKITGDCVAGAFINIEPTVGGVKVLIQEPDVNIFDNASQAAINISGAEEVYIVKPKYTRDGVGTSPTGIRIREHATLPCTKVRIYEPTLTNSDADTPTSGYGIGIGEEVAAAGAGIDNVLVVGGDVDKFNHAVFFGGGVTNALSFDVNVARAIISAICKYTGATVGHLRTTFSEPIESGGSAILLLKAVTGSFIEAARGVVPDGRTIAIAQVSSNGADNSTLAAFRDLDIDVAGSFGELMRVDASNTIEANGNNNFNLASPADLDATAFNYQGVLIDMAAWIASHDAGFTVDQAKTFAHDIADYLYGSPLTLDVFLSEVGFDYAGFAGAVPDVATVEDIANAANIRAELGIGSTATTAQLENIANAINVTVKVTGKPVFNTTTGAQVYATGSAAGAVWNNAGGTQVHAPV